MKLTTEELGLFGVVKFLPAFLLVSHPSLAEILAVPAWLCQLCAPQAALLLLSFKPPLELHGAEHIWPAVHIWQSEDVKQQAK